MKRVAALFALLSLLAIAAPADDFVVLCFGDSITAANKYVSMIGMTEGFKAINAGKSGRRADNAADSLQWYLDHYKDTKIDHVLMFLGVNDLPAKRPEDQKIESCVKGMGQAIDLSLKRFKPDQITLMAPCDVNPETMSTRVRSVGLGYQVCGPMLKRLETEYKKLAEEKKAHFLSLFNVVSKENYLDGLHPNEAGHKQLADAIITHLKKLQSKQADAPKEGD